MRVGATRRLDRHVREIGARTPRRPTNAEAAPLLARDTSAHSGKGDLTREALRITALKRSENDLAA